MLLVRIGLRALIPGRSPSPAADHRFGQWNGVVAIGSARPHHDSMQGVMPRGLATAGAGRPAIDAGIGHHSAG